MERGLGLALGKGQGWTRPGCRLSIARGLYMEGGDNREAQRKARPARRLRAEWASGDRWTICPSGPSWRMTKARRVGLTFVIQYDEPDGDAGCMMVPDVHRGRQLRDRSGRGNRRGHDARCAGLRSS